MKNSKALDEKPYGYSNDKNKNKKKKKKNMQRLGGASGLSLETFANLKSTRNQYNPSIIKKQKEFYKNAKYVQKYKRTVKHQSEQNDNNSAVKSVEGGNEAVESSATNRKNNYRKKGLSNLEEVYAKKHEEIEKSRVEREALIQTKKEERDKSEARRKAMREKMYKKTRSGQPIMKYRIEHLLETIQNSAKNS